MSEGDVVLSDVAARRGVPTKFKPQQTAESIAKAEAVAEYAKRMRDWPLLERAIDEKIEQQREFVEWWRANVRNGRPRKTSDGPRYFSQDAAEEATHITHQQVSKWRARLEKEEEYRSALFGVAYRLLMAEANDNHRAQGTGENEWYTPADHVERVRALLGDIDLDPASSDSAQKIVRAARYFTVKDNGLKQEWHGRVWLNPPYSQPTIQHFSEKWAAETASGRTTESVMLTHNYTDTEWFHIAAKACSALCFTRGRIAFVDPDGVKAAPTQGQAFFYFGPRVSEFTKAFASVGFVR